MSEPAPPRLAAWLRDALGDPGPFTLRRLSGGNSNDTLQLRSPQAVRILRRAPAATVATNAHNMEREHRILAALAPTPAPAPRPLALCTDPDVAPGPILVMEAVDGHALTDSLPDGFPSAAETAAAVGPATIRAIAAVHTVDWRAAGLHDFGRPDGFLERQVARWRRQRERHRVRELPWFDEVGAWLDAHRPPDREPAILHGDFRLDNVHVAAPPVTVTAIIDWEIATIGDPLLDLGLFLAFWGPERPDPPAMPRLQAISRVAGAPSRAALADHYAALTGRPVDDLPWYMALALFKLAAIVEGAYAQHLAGNLDSAYARDLAVDVPLLLEEAAIHAGLRAA